MYDQKMVAAIKVNGKICREFKDTVYIPFGEEYSILIKNLNSRRAIVNITIDGTNAVPGGLVVNANSEVDLERFVKDYAQGNKFKFIERTSQIENGPRGIKADDGLIRVSFKYEKITLPTHFINTFNVHNSFTYPPGVRSSDKMFTNAIATSVSPQQTCDSFYGNITASAAVSQSKFIRASGASGQSLSTNDVGITVPGSLSSQKFVTVSDFLTEDEEHVIVLHILGETEHGKQVSAPVTVNAKPKCVTCGKLNKATAKFCSSCGTSLEII